MITWKTIPGYEGFYEASDDGRIRSLDRLVPHNSSRAIRSLRMLRGRVLRTYIDHVGYLYVGLHRHGERRITTVHILVAAAFLGPKPSGMEVRHLDGVASHCDESNLVYDTHRANEADKLTHGTHIRGERSGTAKLTSADAIKIRASRGIARMVADRYGVSVQTIYDIRNRRRWSWLPENTSR